MTLEEAKITILDKKLLSNIVKVLEFEDFWVFCNDEPTEARPPAIRKKDGSLFWFFYPDYAHMKYKILSKEKGY